MLSNKRQEAHLHAVTPEVGLGNPTETKAFAKMLRDAGFVVTEDYPTGFWIKSAEQYHIRMTQSTDATIKYAQSSSEIRNSKAANILLKVFEQNIKAALKKHPEAQFLITPQNKYGELATEVEYKGKKFFVIMVLPDAMGKIIPGQIITPQQKEISYLVWNQNSYHLMINELGLTDVQLIEPVDPIQGYKTLDKKHLERRGYSEVFNEEKLCVVKLAGSGGDSRVINAAISSLWKKSKVRSIVFPGQKRTSSRILKKYDRKSPTIKKSLDEGEFYNVSRNMQPDSQMMLTYPSEQLKHLMVLSKLDKPLKVVWLPPRGQHEINNLIELMLMARRQGIVTTICIPKKHHQFLHRKLNNAGFSQTLHYELVDPSHLEESHFKPVPSWQENENFYAKTANPKRVSLEQGVRNIVARHQ